MFLGRQDTDKTRPEGGQNPLNLTPKEQKFAEEYVKDFNQTQAVIRAGYHVKNANVAHVIAQRLLQKATVREYLEGLQGEVAERNKITRDYFVTRLRGIIENPEARVNDRINALALLARITGFLQHRAEENKQVVVFQHVGLQ